MIELSKDWERLVRQFPKTRGLLNRSLRDFAVEIFPGVRSDDPSYRAFMQSVHDWAKTNWNVDVSDSGLSTNGYSDDFERWLAVAGRPQYPMGMPIPSNEFIRKEKQLPDDFTDPADERLAEELFECMFGRIEPSPMRINRDSSTMMPSFSTDMSEKVAELEAANEAAREGLFDVFDPGAWIEAGFPAISVTVKRLQSDKQGKKRFVFVDGELVETTTSSGLGPNGDHPRMRVRTAYGAPWRLNGLGTQLLCGARKRYFSEYAATFKHRGPSDLEQKFAGSTALASVDAANFDTTYPEFLLEKLCSMFEESPVYPKWFANVFRALLGAPSLCSNPDMEFIARSHILAGNPYSTFMYSLVKGLQSGVFQNPDLGKYGGVWNLLTGQRVMGEPILGRVDPFLKHELRFRTANASDDNLLGGPTRTALMSWIKASQYFQFDPEIFAVFLGFIPTGSPAAPQFLPNLASYVTNWFVPERSVTDPARKAPATGWRVRREYYARHPGFRKLDEAMHDLFVQHFGYPLSAAAARLSDHGPAITCQTDVDRLFVIKPEIIHYLVDPEDISPEVLATSGGLISEDHVVNLNTQLGVKYV